MESLRDESTGVLSWPAFVEFGNLTAWQTVRRSGSLTLLLVSIDDCAAIRQDFGGQVERSAVMALAGVLQRSLRTGDFVGRHGPRSFAIVGQDVPEDGALRFAQRIRAALPERLTILGNPSAFKVSIGIASVPGAGSAFDDLVHDAEAALTQAAAHGGDRDWLSGVSEEEQSREPALEPVLVTAGAPVFELAEITVLRRDGLQEARAASKRGANSGVAIRTAPGPCPVCLNAARDLYAPDLAPTLPLVGCTSAGGCRCVYAVPAKDPRRFPQPLSEDVYADLHLRVPPRLLEAARFGAHSKHHCSPEDLAEYLDRYPLVPFDAGTRLQQDEVAFFKRDARQVREFPGAAALPHGLRIPTDGALQPALAELQGLPPLPRLREAGKGTLSITNWRLLFRDGHETESVLLVDIAGVECLRDGIACLVSGQSERLIYRLKEPVHAGLVLAWAVQETMAVPS